MTTIVDYGASNLSSILNMFRRIDVPAAVSSDPEVVRRAERLVLPGVGAFDAGMTRLKEAGLDEALTESVKTGAPLLGVCLGAQLLTRRSDEGQLLGLGWLAAETVAFDRRQMPPSLPVPHMGWAELDPVRETRLLAEMPEEPRFYFCHSFHLAPSDEGLVRARVHYGYGFAAVLEQDNVVAAQFHPEKSHRYGMAVLRNFATRY